MYIDLDEVGPVIESLRVSKGMERTLLADRIGVASNSIYRIERKGAAFSLKMLNEICRIIEVPPALVLLMASTNTKDFKHYKMFEKMKAQAENKYLQYSNTL